jgi:hypothetical protein
MSVGKAVGDFLLKVVWPWFVKYVWPILQSFILDLFSDGLGKLRDLFAAATESRMQSRADQAEAKASEAEHAAGVSQSAEERGKQAAVAQVWRQVAEQFRQENEALRQQVSDLATAQENGLAAEVLSSKPQLDTSGTELTVRIGNTIGAVPALPMPSANKEIGDSQ